MIFLFCAVIKLRFKFWRSEIAYKAIPTENLKTGNIVKGNEATKKVYIQLMNFS